MGMDEQIFMGVLFATWQFALSSIAFFEMCSIQADCILLCCASLGFVAEYGCGLRIHLCLDINIPFVFREDDFTTAVLFKHDISGVVFTCCMGYVPQHPPWPFNAPFLDKLRISERPSISCPIYPALLRVPFNENPLCPTLILLYCAWTFLFKVTIDIYLLYTYLYNDLILLYNIPLFIQPKLSAIFLPLYRFLRVFEALCIFKICAFICFNVFPFVIVHSLHRK